MTHFHGNVGGQGGTELRHQFADFLHHLDGVGARLAPHPDRNGALRAVPFRRAHIGTGIDHSGDIAQPYRGAVAIGNHLLAELVGVAELAVRADDLGIRAVQRARGLVHIGRVDRIGQRINADAARRQGAGIGLHSHRIFGNAVHRHVRHAVQHRDFARHQGRITLDGGDRQGLGGQHQEENRLINRIGFVQGRWIDHRLGQLACRRRHRRLYVLCCGIDRAIQLELHRDRGFAQRVGGRHLGDARHGGERRFQWRRHSRGHGFRISARQIGGDLDGGEIDIRQFAVGQLEIARHAEDQQRRHQQGRHHRIFDKPLGDVHGL